ncbi:MAG TPA: hypothetical protein VJ740_13300 [Hyphomicrobiaceae bacterium]|jgi:hypothetical protein|nr:hypothetical protein [Hyphomicrobiaceae bacterium]
MQASAGYGQRLLRRDVPLALTAGLAVINGLDFSPFFDTVSFWLYSFARGSRLYHGEVFYYLTSAAITVMTLLIGGVPAAIYERVRGLQQSSPGSLIVWLAATLLLTWPTLLRLVTLGEE